MVVACGTQRLLNTTTKIGFARFSKQKCTYRDAGSPKEYSTAFDGRENVRLCTRRTFHSSKEPRSALAKLSPQEALIVISQSEIPGWSVGEIREGILADNHDRVEQRAKDLFEVSSNGHERHLLETYPTVVARSKRKTASDFLYDLYVKIVNGVRVQVSNAVLNIVASVDVVFADFILHVTEFYIEKEPDELFTALYAYALNLALERLVAVVTMLKVDSILRANEYNHEFSEGSVKSYDSNQLASNNPIEDTRSEAKCLLTTGLLLGVFDGHGGGACAQVIAKRLYSYIAACLLPSDSLRQYVNSFKTDSPLELFKSYNDKVQFVDDIREVYHKSFVHFLDDLSKVGYKHSFEMSKALEKAFLRLDEDLSREALPDANGQVNLKTLSVAMTGSVACVAHVDGPHLHVAHVGDCNAVLGVRTETNAWIAKKLTEEHNTYNQSEVDRILHEHPLNETNTVIKMERLLGQLAPLRAIGDFRYKWSREVMSSVVTKHFGEHMIAPNYYTPPYLTARPEVIYHRLTPREKFLVLATDGLWDIISPLQVVRLVGEHMSGKVTLSPLKLPRKNMTLSEINEMLLQRKEGLKTKPKDTNAATHLIRNALGGTEYGIDHGKLSQLLSLPEDVVRVFRDDITVTVVYFDSEYLRHCPA